MLYDYIVDPATSQPSEETSGTFPLTERIFPSVFLELMTAGYMYISFGPYGHYFVSYNDLCHLASTVVSQ